MMLMILSFTSIMTETLNFYNPLPIAQTEDDNKHINDNINDEEKYKKLVKRERNLKQVSS